MSGGESEAENTGARATVFRDGRIDRVVTWVLVMFVAVTGWFLRDVLEDLRVSQRSTQEKINDVSRQLSSFQVDLAVLQANYQAVRDVKDTMAKLDSRMLELERAARRETR